MTLDEFYETEWFKERPVDVQEGLRAKPVNKPYFLKSEDHYYGVRVIGMDEYSDKPSTYRIYVDGIMPPGTGRQVFGIKSSDLIAEEDLPFDADILYVTKPVMDIE